MLRALRTDQLSDSIASQSGLTAEEMRLRVQNMTLNNTESESSYSRDGLSMKLR